MEPRTGTGLSVAGEDVNASSVIESCTGPCPYAGDKGCVDVDVSSVIESCTGPCPYAGDKGCADVDASVIEPCTGTCPSVADHSLDGAEPCKGAGPSNESCGRTGGDPSDDDGEYCKGVVPPGGVPRRLYDPVVTSRGTTGPAYTRLRMERTRRVSTIVLY